MEKTKLALAIAELFVALAKVIGGQTAALSCIYLVTALLSELLTNNASAAIMFPIAAAAAEQLGIDINIMSVAVMLGGSAGWILPYSYQCNLMVYAAGKYKTADFVKIGIPYHVSVCCWWPCCSACGQHMCMQCAVQCCAWLALQLATYE